MGVARGGTGSLGPNPRKSKVFRLYRPICTLLISSKDNPDHLPESKSSRLEFLAI